MLGPNAPQVLARVASDPAFKAFGSPEFDPAAFASLVVDADSHVQSPGAQSRAEVLAIPPPNEFACVNS